MRRPKYALLDAGVGGSGMWGRKNGAYADLRVRQTREHGMVRELTTSVPVGYTFNADTYCPGCILYTVSDRPVVEGSYVWRTLCELARERGIDMGEEASYDSSAWPKAIWEHMVEFPETCGRCASYFAQDPNEAPWCKRCETWSGNCGHF